VEDQVDNYESRVPFVARYRTRLPPSAAPSPQQKYDGARQLWLDVASGEPLVTHRIAQRSGAAVAASEFGETLLTKTSEGADQAEGRVEAAASQMASWHCTGPSVAGALAASEFGETLQTESGEGQDQSERLV
jgi:hypothetical protein